MKRGKAQRLPKRHGARTFGDEHQADVSGGARYAEVLGTIQAAKLHASEDEVARSERGVSGTH
jgi:hypothetical protein